ncbi:alpha/beta hydrolase family protein [Mucilaginibacter terrae]|uniref:Dienelactone hydrolase n=1 Tax=Mucilaginibacter terrae TaxID=1955052 RepID=A0ABU3GVK1_9SPHI|nr:hypothetical protein [Mucilaginibacter terrae]MDT3403802.1 dienelactone hydrolase [Mucilaginibacter terrae]
MIRYFTLLLLVISIINCSAASGTWESTVTGCNIKFTATEATTPAKDFAGNYVTVVYLENLNLKNAGRNSNQANVAWLLAQGYRVIELNYAGDKRTVSPVINQDIMAINKAIANGSFCGYKDCSHEQSYVLFEGYRIVRNVPYFKDDPTVYNSPIEYKEGVYLKMDIVYPANPAKPVPVILSFSYSNSYATYNGGKKALTDEHKNQRLKLEYSLAAFNDSFLEGAPANGMAWAIADHPKYCQWGKGKPVNGREDTYKSYQTNPDAARKVRSAVRTLRKMDKELGLSGKIGIYGFSRGSTAGSLAVGDRSVEGIDTAGFNTGTSAKVQAAALGPGVFDYTQIYNILNDGDGNLETRCVWAWGELDKNYALWRSMGSAYLVQSSASPVMFFHNTDDDYYYQDQIAHFKARLDSLHVPVSTMVNYGNGHSVPQTPESLNQLYRFFSKYLKPLAVRK